MKYELRKIMKRAWELKKNKTNNFKFGTCLKLAWAEFKAVMSGVLTGTERQIRWAKDIKVAVAKIAAEENCIEVLRLFAKKTDAAFIIENGKFATSKYTDYSKKARQCEEYDYKLALRH